MIESLKKYIKDYLYFLEFKENKKYNTILSVKNDLEKFEAYFSEKNIDADQIDLLSLNEYFQYLKKSGLAVTTYNRRLASIKKFLKFLKGKNIIKFNISLNLENIKLQEKEVEYMTLDEIEELRKVIKYDNFNGLRDRLIFELLYSSGLTVSELLSLGELNINIEKREIYFLKNRERKLLFFSKTAKYFYELFLNSKEKKFADKNNKNVIFVNNSNNRLTDRSIRRIIEKYTKLTGIKKEISPYTIRHSFCIHMLEKGMPKEYLMKLLNMKNSDIFFIYEKKAKKENL